MISRDRFYTINRYFSISNYSSDIKTPLVILEYKTQRINKFGIKFFAKANSLNGYVYHIIPYIGKNFNYDKKIGLGPSIVKYLVKHDNFNYKGYCFTFDNFYRHI